MFKYTAFILYALFAVASAEPKPAVIAPLAYSAPVVAATPGAAVYSREYHGNFAPSYVAAAPYVSAPYVAAGPASPYVASPYVASAPYAASYAPYAASYAPYAAYTAPVLLRK